MAPAQSERGTIPLRFRLPWSRRQGETNKKPGPRSLSASLGASAGTLAINNNHGSKRFPDSFGAPTIITGDEDGVSMTTRRDSEVAEWEVYMCYRALRASGSSFYQRLPDFIKMELRDVGLCHYMVVLKCKHQTKRRRDLRWWDSQGDRLGQEQDEYIQFDFGPRGYDITFSRAAKKPILKEWKLQQLPNLPSPVHSRHLASTLGLSFTSEQMTPLAVPAEPAGVGRVYPVFALPGLASTSTSLHGTVELWADEEGEGDAAPSGEIREERLSELPPTAELVGTAVMSLEDIRTFNSTLNMDYVLNRNDCRHYVDSLMEFLTGADKACATFMRRRMQQRLEKYAAGSSQACEPKVPASDLRHHLLQLAQLALEKESADVLSRVWGTLSPRNLPRWTIPPEPHAECSPLSQPHFSIPPPAYHDSARMRPAPAGAGKSESGRSPPMQPMLVPVNWAQRGLHQSGNAAPTKTLTGLGRTRRPPPRGHKATSAVAGTMLSLLTSTIIRQKGRDLFSIPLRRFGSLGPAHLNSVTEHAPALRPRPGVRNFMALPQPPKQCRTLAGISQAIRCAA